MLARGSDSGEILRSSSLIRCFCSSSSLDASSSTLAASGLPRKEEKRPLLATLPPTQLEISRGRRQSTYRLRLEQCRLREPWRGVACRDFCCWFDCGREAAGKVRDVLRKQAAHVTTCGRWHLCGGSAQQLSDFALSSRQSKQRLSSWLFRLLFVALLSI